MTHFRECEDGPAPFKVTVKHGSVVLSCGAQELSVKHYWTETSDVEWFAKYVRRAVRRAKEHAKGKR